MMYQDVNQAVYKTLQELYHDGKPVTVRGMKTKELMFHNFTIASPLHRICLFKERNINIFAQVAETLWMLYGRDDLDWLEYYIPQCKRWSDDGVTWRAAYGPRLRYWRTRNLSWPEQWEYVDQIAEIVNKLRTDPQTRQAVITLWDPADDWVEGSKDYPCNNWLHFIIRNNQLHLNVGVRSNDIIYGFSHIDFFSWSVLLECVAYWVGVQPGMINWNATSMHLYERHEQLADDIINSHFAMFRYPKILRFQTDWDDCDEHIRYIFDNEEAYREDGVADTQMHFNGYTTDLMSIFDDVLRIYSYMKQNPTKLKQLLVYCGKLPECDIKQAVIQYITNKLSG